MRKKTIIKGTIILTIASLISRVLGFINRIYLSNLIGAEGMGLYQLVFPIYMVCYTFCCSGLFIAISKLTASHLATGNRKEALKTVFIATSIATFIGSVLAVVLFAFSDYIAVHIIHEARICYALKIVSISIPFTAICHSLKGYFYGIGEAKVPAYSIVLEQTVRISIIYILSANFARYGLSYACNMAIAAMVIGEVIACSFIIINYTFHTKKHKIKHDKPINNSSRALTRMIISIALPLTTNRLITTLLSSFETILIPTKLCAHGYSHQYAISIYGTLTGMALPLIFFPTVLTSSASLMLLGSISDAHARKQTSIITYTTSKTIKFTLLLGIVFAFFFLIFGKELGNILYHEDYVGTLLTTLAFLCPCLYLTSTLASILNGIEKHMITFRNNIIGLSLRIIFIYCLIPIFGIKGYLYGLITSLFIVASLNVFHLLKHINISFDIYIFIVKPCFCAFVSSFVIYFITSKNFTISNSTSLSFIFKIGIYFLLTAVLLIYTRTISLDDLHKAKDLKPI